MRKRLFEIFCAVLSLVATGCASAPRVTLAQVPVYPGAVALAAGEHVMNESSVVYVLEQGRLLRRNFKLTGAHVESNYRVPRTAETQDTQRSALTGWYFKQLDVAGWRSNYTTAGYTVYVNSAGQYLTVYVMTGTTLTDEFELVLTLDE